MRKLKAISPLVRAVGVFSAVAVIVGGVTFAALNGSTATLTGTTLASGTADLQLWNGTAFADTAPGFQLNNLVPGTASDPQAFYFKNNGTVPLDVYASVPTAPTLTGIANLSDVKVKIACDGAATSGVETTLAALTSSTPVDLGLTLPVGAQGNSGAPGTVGNCAASFTLDAEDNASTASVTAFDIVFNGVAQGTNPGTNAPAQAPVTPPQDNGTGNEGN